jgi:ubiquinone/menaquinone biosynthesis C-methylase UbiE
MGVVVAVLAACLVPAGPRAQTALPTQTPAHPATPPAPAGTPPARTQSLAPYVPTPQDVVDRMLTLAGVTATDVVYDLGCGDGRLVITAARRFGARGVGVDIDPERIAESRANATKAGVEALVTFKLQDALEVDVSPASVVTLYLLSSSNLKLRPRLTAQLRPGSRIVSHAFSMGDWEAETVDTFRDANGTTRTLYLWRTDGKVRP